MHNLDSFDHLRRELNASHTLAAAMYLFDLVRERSSGWSGQTCLDWLPRLVHWLQDGLDGAGATHRHLIAVRQDDDQIEPEDVIACGDRLFEDLLARLSAHGVARLPEVAFDHVVTECTLPNSFEIPRRYLIGWYVRWCETGMVPGVWEYFSQVLEKATRTERVDITELLKSTDGQVSEIAPHWIRSSISDAVTERPGVVPGWLKYLREESGDDADAETIAFIGYWEDWLRRLPSPESHMPAEIVAWLVGPRLDRGAVSAARLAIESCAAPHFQVAREHLDGLLQRDLGILNPLLPTHLAGTQEETRRLLQAFLRLEACGAAPPLVACGLLTLAIETELRWALGRGLHRDDQRRIRSCGISRLARFAASEPVSELAGLRISGNVSKKLRTFLRRAGRVRNAVHHDAGSIVSNDRTYLRRAIFDLDKLALRVMEQFAELSCTRSPSRE